MLILLISIFIVHTFYWLGISFLLRNPLYFNNLNNKWPPVSIIICVKNEVDQLKSNLQLILNQDYPEFELIIIDDHSIDGSYEHALLKRKTHKNLKLIQYTKNIMGKKDLLNVGVNQASFPWLLFTDADCKPNSPYWIKYMMNNVNSAKKIVIGYSPYLPQKTFLNLYIRFEAQIHSFLYLSAALAGIPYMAVGRNVLYHKSIFNYQEMDPTIPYGDDDILINKKAIAKNTIVCYNKESFVTTIASKTLFQYLNQKRRHIASSLKYTYSSKLMLMGFYGSLVLLYILLICVAWTNLLYAGIIYSLHLIVVWPIGLHKGKLLHDSQSMYYFPLMELLFVGHLIIQSPFIFFPKKTW